ncbi:MAG TPA: metal-sensitive transcriptional regulator [Acidimicrobiales bacterium]|nr:metal-sensitive transcriptional regulator [Acidimicrobiales bacterium]
MTNEPSHVLEDQEQIEAIVKRLKRAQGQMGAVIRMLEDGRPCNEIIMQISAVGKAVNTAAFKLIAANLKECLIDSNQDSEVMTEQLQKLFLSLA